MIVFVIPAFNEEANIGRLLDEMDVFARQRGWAYRTIIVDDGSVDRTAAIVREKSERFPCEVLSYTPNRGVGEAFRRGLRAALEAAGPEAVIITKEADRTSDLSILPELLEKIQNGCDVALASCYAEGGGVKGATPFRILMSRCANTLIDRAFHIRGVHTYSSFYRAYRPSALKSVLERYGDFFEEPGFACVIELLVRLSKLKMRIEEVPMVLEGGRRAGKSKMKVRRTIAGYLRVISRNFFRPVPDRALKPPL